MKSLLLKFVILSCISHSVWAYHNVTSSPSIPHGWYVGLGTGATFPSIDDNNTISSGPGWPNDQYKYQTANSAALVSVMGGYTWTTCQRWFPALSLAANYTYVYPTSFEGRVKQYSLNAFSNYDFEYKLQRQTLLAIVKADIYRWYSMMPFVSLGGGFSFNKASNYNETALPGISPRVSPGFTSDTTTQLSYTLGAGLDFIATNHFLLSLEYNYGYFGHVRTGSGYNNFASEKLNTKLNSSTVAFNANYYFNKSV